MRRHDIDDVGAGQLASQVELVIDPEDLLLDAGRDGGQHTLENVATRRLGLAVVVTGTYRVIDRRYTGCGHLRVVGQDVAGAPIGFA